MMRIYAFTLASCLLGTISAFADSYTISIAHGSSLIANQLDHGNNTLDEVLPGMPDGAQVLKYVCTTNYVTNTYSASLPGWIPSGGTLAPGEGAVH